MASTSNEINTVVLFTGETVFSRDGKRATSYANRTQAYASAAKLEAQNMPAVVIRRGRPFFVKVTGRIVTERIDG